MLNDEIIGELKKITHNNGIIKAEEIVTIAQDKKSPLHNYFEWDNKKAGHQYRLWQARILLNVAVELINPETETTRRVFVSLSSDRKTDGGGYRGFSDVLDNEHLRKILLDDALREMKHFVEKYNQLSELNRVIEEIIKVQNKQEKSIENSSDHMVKIQSVSI